MDEPFDLDNKPLDREDLELERLMGNKIRLERRIEQKEEELRDLRTALVAAEDQLEAFFEPPADEREDWSPPTA